jgi:hypothetical protein
MFSLCKAFCFVPWKSILMVVSIFLSQQNFWTDIDILSKWSVDIIYLSKYLYKSQILHMKEEIEAIKQVSTNSTNYMGEKFKI